MTRDDLLTLSQRLREYNHNPHHINPVSDAFHKLITESAEALSQLAAIQGGMGEEPLVVATAILGGLFHGGSGPELGDIDVEVCTPHLEKIQCETVDSSDDVFIPLMTVAQHQRIVASISAQQSAHVSVPRDLLADLISSDHDTRIQAERALYTLLASHAEGGKV